MAGLAIVGALGFAVKSSSDLQESVGAVGKVFGTSADKVLAFWGNVTYSRWSITIGLQ